MSERSYHGATSRSQQTGRHIPRPVEYRMDREIAEWVHHERSIRRPLAPPYHRDTSRSFSDNRDIQASDHV